MLTELVVCGLGLTGLLGFLEVGCCYTWGVAGFGLLGGILSLRVDC